MKNVIIIDLHPISLYLQLTQFIKSLYQSIFFIVYFSLSLMEYKNCKQDLTSFYFKKIIFIFPIFMFILITIYLKLNSACIFLLTVIFTILFTFK